MNKIKQYPILFSLILIFLIILLNRIPLNDFILSLNIDEFNAEALSKIIFNSVVLTLLLFILFKISIPYSLFNSKFSTNIIYYLPLLAYLIIFSGGFNFINFETIPTFKLTFYSLRIFTAAFLEEILFRGVILGLLINKFYNSKNGVLKSVFISGLLFGSVHILNIWTYDNSSIHGVLNQIYAAACLGIMYGSVYLKTKSIFILSILHFFSNFFALYSELLPEIPAYTTDEIDPSILNMIISEFFRIIIFGIPLGIGLFIIYKINIKDVQYFSNNQDRKFKTFQT